MSGNLKRINPQTVEELADAINAVIDGADVEIVDPEATLTTTRLASLGLLSQAESEGKTRYRWKALLDKKTCATCKTLHGRVFDVSLAVAALVDVLRARDPDASLKLMPVLDMDEATAAQLRASRSEELQAQGIFAPPAHVSCRCTLEA